MGHISLRRAKIQKSPLRLDHSFLFGKGPSKFSKTKKIVSEMGRALEHLKVKKSSEFPREDSKTVLLLPDIIIDGDATHNHDLGKKPAYLRSPPDIFLNEFLHFLWKD